jgi:undecaprenyl-phosphate 4-deoxy-4-formamido-L-arabinose transferase
MSRNYGQHNAILHGIRVAEGDVVVTLDDDLQHPPEEVPKLLGELATGTMWFTVRLPRRSMG